jgi:hypothetical protein
MPQETSRGRNDGRIVPMRATLARTVLGVAVLGLGFLNAPAARADADNPVWDKFMQSIGLKKAPETQINYTERSPLVVPPSRDLPPPASDAAAPPAPDWPRDPNTIRAKQSKTNAIVPGTGPIQTPNPPLEKHWYNPADWFSKEEYGTFVGEPVRADLTDPPAGYRIPSPSQPYGISPEGKKTKPTASDFNMVQVSGQNGSK